MITKKGFTLGELLITLGIIGVIAALTMPALNLSIQNSHNKARFRKTINLLSSAISSNLIEDNYDFSNTDSGGNAEGDMSIYNIFFNHLDVMNTKHENNEYTLTFKDGSTVVFSDAATGCTEDSPCNATIDVNGPRNPNRLVSCDTNDCKVTTLADRFPVKFYDDMVVPNSQAAREVFYNKK